MLQRHSCNKRSPEGDGGRREDDGSGSGGSCVHERHPDGQPEDHEERNGERRRDAGHAGGRHVYVHGVQGGRNDPRDGRGRERHCGRQHHHQQGAECNEGSERTAGGDVCAEGADPDQRHHAYEDQRRGRDRDHRHDGDGGCREDRGGGHRRGFVHEQHRGRQPEGDQEGHGRRQIDERKACGRRIYGNGDRREERNGGDGRVYRGKRNGQERDGRRRNRDGNG